MSEQVSTRDGYAAACADSKVATDPDFKSAPRLQSGLLTPIERVCLNWLVRRMPARVKPDHLTLLGFAAMLMAGATYAMAKWWPPALLIVNFWLAINWFGDSLDGTLARARNKQRPRYGFYVDHIVDAFGALFLTAGLAVSGYIRLEIALAMLAVYFLLSIDVYLATYTRGAFRMSFYKFGPTELRLLIVIGNVRAFIDPTARILESKYLFYDVAAVVAMALMAIVVITSVARNTVALYRAERV